jgi:uncharacterized protein
MLHRSLALLLLYHLKGDHAFTTVSPKWATPIRRLHMIQATMSTSVVSFENYVESTIPAWLKSQDSLPFACTECGKCCQREGGNVYMNREEFTAAAAYLQMDETTFVRKYSKHVLYDETGEVSWIHFSSDNGSCVFLDAETKHCIIHDVKPIQCRTYPFYPSLLKSPQAWAAECRRAGNDTTSTLPPWSSTASGCEGIKPLDSVEASSMQSVPIQTVLEQVYEFEQHERELYGDLYESEWQTSES